MPVSLVNGDDETERNEAVLGKQKECRQVKKALAQGEAYFSAIFNNAGIGIALSDLHGYVIEVNPAFQRMLGYSQEELRKISFKQYTHPDDVAADARLASELVAGKRDVFQIEKRYIRRDGQIIWTHLTVSALKDATGKVQFALVMLEDITERKIAEEQLAYHAALLANVSDVIVATNTAGIVTYWSPSAEKVYGWNANEVIGKHVFEAVGLELTKEQRASNPTINVAEKWHGQVCHRTKGGKLLWMDIITVPVCDGNGQPVGVVGVHHDITEYKRLQFELESYSKDLEKVIEERTGQLRDKERLAAIGQTAGMVGHDLRNPLQSIIGEVYLAKAELKSIPDSDHKVCLQESIQTIAEQISYMDKIVSDLQTFVKPVEPRMQVVNLKPLIVSLLAQADIPTNIQTSVQMEEVLPVNADPQLLKRVLINLVTNAVQAMPQGGELTIKAQIGGAGQVQIVVEDTGTGVPEEIKPKLFTPLFTTKSKGQGFGLAVCKRVIEAQGGTISFESEVGKGTKFVVSLPALKS